MRLDTAPREWLEAVLEVALERLNLDPNLMSPDPGTAALEVVSPKVYRTWSGGQDGDKYAGEPLPFDAPYVIPTEKSPEGVDALILGQLVSP